MVFLLTVHNAIPGPFLSGDMGVFCITLDGQRFAGCRWLDIYVEVKALPDEGSSKPGGKHSLMRRIALSQTLAYALTHRDLQPGSQLPSSEDNIGIRVALVADRRIQ
jgi:hypothetical protein